MVYGIARQESAFDPRARSSAGALGLLQLMPTTAANTAKAIGARFSKDRLTSDPGYNATLGAAHLRELLAPYKRPSHIVALSELPTNTNGKVLKRTLKDQALGLTT